MVYLGSKKKISKYILPIILKDRKHNQCYVEPFVGGANTIDKVEGRRIGNDINYYLIEMWRALQRGWQPPTNITKEYYYEIKQKQKELDPALVGFVGFNCSFGGKWFSSYAYNKLGRNYAITGSNVVLKQIEKLKGVIFMNFNYWDMPIEPNSLIYCDPPYEGTTKYKDAFNNKMFWDWCRIKKEEGHDIFVSEYNAPNDFKCLKTIDVKTILDKNKQYSRVEKLFTI
jgi:DNA adenine methylase